MNIKFFIFTVVLLLLAGCANPVNQATSNNYSKDCYEEELAGNLAFAQEACYRALVNVEWGNLGQEQKSEKMYNLGRIKRKMSKYSEAEQLFKESLKIEESQKDPAEVKIGRRLVELSLSIAQQNKWEEAAEYLQRVIPISVKFTGQERKSCKEVFLAFSEKLREDNKIDIANQFQEAAKKLQ